MTRYWFKPKRYGYGATPVTWEGWAVTLAFAAFVIGMVWWHLNATPSTAEWFYWIAAILIATAVLVFVSYRKTDGGWRWQWGVGPGSSSKR